VSTNHVILYSGATPVFVDIDPATLNLDLNLVEEAITDRTRAIMVVHYAGNPVDMHQLYTLAKKHGLGVIEDAAHACGAFYKTGPIGSFGLTCFSFHAVKNLPTGDGGMITTNDKDTYERLLRLRWLGIDRSTFDRRTSDGYKWEYDVSELGTKSYMNDITAAIGIEQLKGLDCWNAFRADIVWRYIYGLSSCVEILEETEGAISANHLMVVKVDNRDRVVSRLKEKGIETGVHYKPNHLYDMYQPYVRSPLIETEEAYGHIVSLPLHLGLSDEDVNFVIESVKESL
jgi:perosamine synthetase